MKTKIAMMCMTLLVATTAVAGVAAATGEPENNEQCVNHGNQVAWSVTGDATIECVSQNCETAPAGAGSVGTSVGANTGTSNPGGSASAGTGCEQSAGGEAISNPLRVQG